jgi:hypothetical protein
MIESLQKHRIIPNGIIILAAIFISLLSGWMILHGQFRMDLLVIIILLATEITLINPRVALVLIILGVFSLEYLSGRGLLPTAGVWAVDGLVLVLFVRLMLMDKERTGRFWRSSVLKFLLIWAAIVLLSAVANTSSPLQAVLGMRVYVRFALLYCCLVEFKWEPKFLKSCLILIGMLVFLQVPIVLLQKRSGLDFDVLNGTIASGGGTGQLGILAVGVSMGLVAYAVLANNQISLLLGVGVLILPVLAAARAYFLVIPIMLLFTYLRLPSKGAKWQFAIIFVVVALLISNWDRLQGYVSFGGNTSVVEAIKNPQVILDELSSGPVAGTQGATIGRFTGMQLTWSQISRSVKTFLLGFGPGAAQGSRFGSLQSSLFEDLALAGGRASQLTRSLLEWGVLGTLAYALVFGMLWIESEKCYRKFQDPFWKAAALCHIGFVLLGIILSGYTSTWSGTSVSFLVWFLAGALQRQINAV